MGLGFNGSVNITGYPVNVLLSALSTLNSKGVRSDNIMVQKFLFFVDCYGMKTGFRFEPFTYGPFSFDLAETIQKQISLKMIGHGALGHEGVIRGYR